MIEGSGPLPFGTPNTSNEFSVTWNPPPRTSFFSFRSPVSALKPILYYVLGLRFGASNVPKREKNTKKTTSSCFYATPSVITNIEKEILTFFPRFHSHFGYQHVGIKNASENTRKKYIYLHVSWGYHMAIWDMAA